MSGPLIAPLAQFVHAVPAPRCLVAAECDGRIIGRMRVAAHRFHRDLPESKIGAYDRDGPGSDDRDGARTARRTTSARRCSATTTSWSPGSTCMPDWRGCGSCATSGSANSGWPKGCRFEIPLRIQARSFDLDDQGRLTGRLVQTDPEVIEVFPPFTVVNGKV